MKTNKTIIFAHHQTGSILCPLLMKKVEVEVIFSVVYPPFI
ncbi:MULTISPECIES: hypothetical protein [Bacillus]|nr:MULTISPECIES: hypothetical protein [Bacillus]MDJ0287585.1 hypothetical protein [Bacillus altitudinis]WGU99505.1 hypothetical protein QJS56_13205 [Bacillus altitudinis]WHF27618.1 hypothetical protein QJS65_02890 [Bacillus altitudinis]WOQ73072.1 hypothetical protein R0126_01530 [Bacillus stratosphericus]